MRDQADMGVPQSSWSASAAPSASARSLAHWIEGCTRRTYAPWAEAAVGAAHHVLAADHTSEPDESLRHQLGMFDNVRVVRDNARNEHLARWQLHVLPKAPFVLVAGVRLLDRVIACRDLEHETHNVGE